MSIVNKDFTQGEEKTNKRNCSKYNSIHKNRIHSWLLIQQTFLCSFIVLISFFIFKLTNRNPSSVTNCTLYKLHTEDL